MPTGRALQAPRHVLMEGWRRGAGAEGPRGRPAFRAASMPPPPAQPPPRLGPELCRDQPGRGGEICVAAEGQVAVSVPVVRLPRAIAAAVGPGHLRVARHARGDIELLAMLAIHTRGWFPQILLEGDRRA